jgi:hypothetical protein
MTALFAQGVAIPTDLNSALPYLIGAAILAVLTRLFPDLGRLLAPATPAPTPGTPTTPPAAPGVPAVLAGPVGQRLLQALAVVVATTPNKADDVLLPLLQRLLADHPPEQPK